jgi:ADP-ribose pyrophosphatase
LSSGIRDEVLFRGRFVELVRRARARDHSEQSLYEQGRSEPGVRLQEVEPAGIGWEFARRTASSGVVAVVAINDAGKLVLVEQYREPVERRVIELPAGLSGDLPGSKDEDPELAAERELLEETGYRAGTLTRFGEGPSSAGLCDEITQFFHAQELERVADGGGVNGERIVVHEIPIPELRGWLAARAREGMLIDPKILAGLYLAQVPGVF